MKICPTSLLHKHATANNGTYQSAHQNVVHLPISQTHQLIVVADLLACSKGNSPLSPLSPSLSNPAPYLYTHRIQRGVEVAQPKEERCNCRMKFTILAQAHCECHDKERQPTDDKGAGDDGQCLCRLSFPFRLEQLPTLGQFLVWIRNACQHALANAHRTAAAAGACSRCCSSSRAYCLIAVGCGCCCCATHGDGLGQRRYGIQMGGYQMMLRGAGHLL